MAKQILSKASWKDAVGLPKRLKLLSHNGLFICPVAYCESEPYRSKRGCRKHVFTKHGITTLKKSQILPKFFPNLVHVQTTINALNEGKPLICQCS